MELADGPKVGAAARVREGKGCSEGDGKGGESSEESDDEGGRKGGQGKKGGEEQRKGREVGERGLVPESPRRGSLKRKDHKEDSGGEELAAGPSRRGQKESAIPTDGPGCRRGLRSGREDGETTGEEDGKRGDVEITGVWTPSGGSPVSPRGKIRTEAEVSTQLAL